MKLTIKLTLLLALSFLMVMFVRTIAQVSEEAELVSQYAEQNQLLLGRATQKAFNRVWRTEGPQQARDLLDELTAASEGRLQLRFVPLDAASSTDRPLDAVAFDECVHNDKVVSDRPALLDMLRDSSAIGYAPAKVGGRIVGAIEILDSLQAQQSYIYSALWRMLAAALTIATAWVVASWGVGDWIIGAPVRDLVARAHRIGAGDFESPGRAHRHDELGELAAAMDRMSAQLADQQRRIREEAAARLAAVDQLRHAERLTTVGKLAAGVAHELGTPLHVVHGRARMIESREAEGEEALECARIVREQAERMTSIVRQLLDFARQREPAKALTDLASMADSTLAMLRPLARKQGVELVLEAPPEGLSLAIDPAQIQQVLANIVMNGIQASRSGSRLEVSMGEVKARSPFDRGRPEARFACIRVADQGSGMPAELMRHLFEPFFTTKPVGQGTGLGLSVSYGIVREHDGWIDVETTEGTGSSFLIYLPLNAPDLPPLAARG